MTGGPSVVFPLASDGALTTDEWRRLEELDSRLFGFLNLQARENYTDLNIVTKAVRLLEKQLLDRKKLDETEETKIEDAKIYLKLGHLQLLCHDFAKALSAFQRVYELEKDTWKDSNFFYGLGLVYHHFRAYKFAAEAFLKVLYVTPNFERVNEVNLRLGLLNEALEDWDQALKHLKSALIGVEGKLSGSPDGRTDTTLGIYEIKYHIALCYDQKGDLKRGRDLYDELTHSNGLPLHVKAAVFRQLGWLHYRAEDIGPDRVQRLLFAVDWLLNSAKQDPNCGKTYYYLGRCYSAIPGKAHEAFVNYRHSIDKSEASADTWCSIGVLYQQQQQPMDALQAFVCAVQLDGHHSAAWVDLGLLYESVGQFKDALNCFQNAAKHRPDNPEALKVRIELLESELKKAPPNPPPTKQNKHPLPNLDEAWRLPIPAELTQRQEGFLKQKQERYISGSPLLAMGAVSGGGGGEGEKPPFYLSSEQVQMMHILMQNHNQLDVQQMQALRNLQQNYALMQQHMKYVQQQRQLPRQGVPEELPQLPQIPTDDIESVLGQGTGNTTLHSDSAQPSTQNKERRQGSNSTDDFLGALGESSDDGATKDDPMLSSAALSSKDGAGAESAPGSVAGASTGGDVKPTGVQDNNVSSSTTAQDVGADSSNDPAETAAQRDANSLLQRISVSTAEETGPLSLLSPGGHVAPPPKLNLLAPINIPNSTSAHQIIQMCKARAQNPSAYKPIYQERCRPPAPPSRPKEVLPKEQLLLPTPSVVIDSKKDAVSLELQQFCYNSPCVLIKGLTAWLRIDLGLFSTKTLVETAPDHQVEVRTQLKVAPEKNNDQFGVSNWFFESTRSFTSIAKYAQYQAQTFQHSLKEEQEKLKAMKGKEEEGYGGKRGRMEVMEPEGTPNQVIKFGTNVDLSDEVQWRTQIQELSKLPSFLRLSSPCNPLTHLGHTVFGMNTIQLYMKVPGSRTPGHQENNNFCAININIGPGECEWFATPQEYWGEICRMCEKRKLDYLKGSWWPPLQDLWDANIPVYRFTQKPGDVVWLGPGCVHWVQATGWCNNIAWNVGGLTGLQTELALERYEWNKLQAYKSIVPMQHLFWQLARNIRFTDTHIFEAIKGALVRSLAYIQMTLDYVASYQKPVKHHPKLRGEVAHYCGVCEIEVFNILFVTEDGVGKFVVHCVDCARRMDPQLKIFTVLQQYVLEDLVQTFDNCLLNPVRICAFNNSTSTIEIGNQ